MFVSANTRARTHTPFGHGGGLCEFVFVSANTRTHTHTQRETHTYTLWSWWRFVCVCVCLSVSVHVRVGECRLRLFKRYQVSLPPSVCVYICREILRKFLILLFWFLMFVMYL